jgi:phage terminase large subunit
LYQKAVADPEHWFSLLLTAEQSGVLSEEKLANQRKFQSPEQYAQEFCCDFQAAIVGSYYGKLMAAAEQDGRIRHVEAIDGAPIHTAWDLGVRDSTAIWAFQVVGPAAQGEEGEIHILGYYENNGEPISHYVQELVARDWCGGIDWLPHDARIRSSDTLRTRIETLVLLGRNPAIAPEQKFQDGIEAARLTIPKCVFDPEECAHGLKALRAYSQRWDDRKKTYLDRPDHNWASHGADAWRYLSCAWQEVPALKPRKALSYEKARWAQTRNMCRGRARWNT